MHISYSKLSIGLFLLSITWITGCRTPRSNDASDIRDAAWVWHDKETDVVFEYKGPMPNFVDYELFVSLEGRTLRFEGRPLKEPLPVDIKSSKDIFDSDGKIKDELQQYFYTQSEFEDYKQEHGLDYAYFNEETEKWYTVFPIAIGKSANESEGDYNFTRIQPRREYQYASQSYGAHTWNLLPFLAYKGGIAFHTPYSYYMVNGKKMLHLLRGPVSGGCKRMAFEHIVELAHMLNINTRVPHNSRFSAKDEVTKKINAFGSKELYIHTRKAIDQVNQAQVDVNYPLCTENAPKYDKANSKVHRTWNLASEARSSWICFSSYKNPSSECQPFPEENIMDPLETIRTGEKTNKITCDSFVQPKLDGDDGEDLF